MRSAALVFTSGAIGGHDRGVVARALADQGLAVIQVPLGNGWNKTVVTSASALTALRRFAREQGAAAVIWEPPESRGAANATIIAAIFAMVVLGGALAECATRWKRQPKASGAGETPPDRQRKPGPNPNPVAESKASSVAGLARNPLDYAHTRSVVPTVIDRSSVVCDAIKEARRGGGRLQAHVASLVQRLDTAVAEGTVEGALEAAGVLCGMLQEAHGDDELGRWCAPHGVHAMLKSVSGAVEHAMQLSESNDLDGALKLLDAAEAKLPAATVPPARPATRHQATRQAARLQPAPVGAGSAPGNGAGAAGNAPVSTPETKAPATVHRGVAELGVFANRLARDGQAVRQGKNLRIPNESAAIHAHLTSDYLVVNFKGDHIYLARGENTFAGRLERVRHGLNRSNPHHQPILRLLDYMAGVEGDNDNVR